MADAKSTTVGREDRAIGGAEMSSLGNARRCYPGSNHDDLSVSSWLTPSISRSPISRRLSDFPYFDGWRRIALRRICQGIQCRRCRDLSYIAHFTESRSRLDKLAQDGPVLQLLLRRSSWKPLRTRSRGARKLLEGPGGPKFAGWPRLASQYRANYAEFWRPILRRERRWLIDRCPPACGLGAWRNNIRTSVCDPLTVWRHVQPVSNLSLVRPMDLTFILGKKHETCNENNARWVDGPEPNNDAGFARAQFKYYSL